jgi:hypothetical protein
MIKVSSVKKEDTAWDKHIRLTYEDKEYLAILHWDKWDGYELISFIDPSGKWIDTPEWAINWEENNEKSLNYVLDELSDEKIEEN